MLAQYYPDEKIILVFNGQETDEYLFKIPKEKKKIWGFPPFSKWNRTSWGYEIEFHFEVVKQ